MQPMILHPTEIDDRIEASILRKESFRKRFPKKPLQPKRTRKVYESKTGRKNVMRGEDARPYLAQIAVIIASVAQESGLTIQDILGDSREARISKPRNEAIWRARILTGAPFSVLGTAFKRHYTTCKDAFRSYEDRMRLAVG